MIRNLFIFCFKDFEECLLLNLILNVASAIAGITLSALLFIFIFVTSKFVGWKFFDPLSNLISFNSFKIFKKITKKNKSKFKIDYRVSGEAFLTKPNETTHMIQNVIKKVTKIKPKLSTTGGTSDLRFIRKISPGLEFGLVGKTMHKVDEAVSLKDLKNLKKIYENILLNYFK